MIAAATALASLLSALTPDMAWRGHVVKDMGLVQLAAVFHAAVVPLATALLLASYYLWRRRRRAFAIAFVLLIAIGVFNVLKGLDVEEALLAWVGAGVLWWGRGAFTVEPGPVKLGASIVTAAAALTVTVGCHLRGRLVGRQRPARPGSRRPRFGRHVPVAGPADADSRQSAIRASGAGSGIALGSAARRPGTVSPAAVAGCRCPIWPSAPAPPT